MGKGNHNLIKLDSFSITSFPDPGGKLDDNPFGIDEFLLPKKQKQRNNNNKSVTQKLNKKTCNNNNNYKSFSKLEIEQLFTFNYKQDIRDIAEEYYQTNNKDSNNDNNNIEEENMNKVNDQDDSGEGSSNGLSVKDFEIICTEEDKIVNNNIEENTTSDNSFEMEMEMEEEEILSSCLYNFLEKCDFEDSWEDEFFGTKFDGEHLRHCNKNKKDRIKRFYINSYLQMKENRNNLLLSQHFADRCASDATRQQIKENRTFRQTPEQSYEKELQVAMSMSAAEYDRNLGNTLAVTTLTQRQINDLLNRELTPEDYELLLLLDNSVKPKTTPQNVLRSLPTVKFSPTNTAHKNCDTCMVCLNEFNTNETVTNLPKCNHIFHGECINNWLANSSRNCPIDGLPCFEC